MKKILAICIAVAASLCVSAQDSTRVKTLDCYFGASLSTATGNNFYQSSYASAELGVCRKNTSFAFAMGRGNLDASPYGKEKIDNYWFEAKAYATVPIGNIKGIVVFGWGQYFNSNHSFIEYGAGFSYSVKKFDLGLTVSNWDNVVYVSPGISYNFSFKK